MPESKAKKQNLKQEPHSSENNETTTRKVLVFDYREFFTWLFKIDNLRIAIALFGLFLSIVGLGLNSYFNLATRNHRIKTQLGESFRIIEKMRSEHLKELMELHQVNTRLQNKIDVLSSESKIFQDKLNTCRSKQNVQRGVRK